MSYNRGAFYAEAVRNEGLRQKPYRDTVGKLSIGIGRNLDDVGLREDEIVLCFWNDVKRSEDDLDRHCPWWRQMTDARQRALLDMCFNMGWGDGTRGLSSFRNTLKLLELGRYAEAADNCLKSKWAQQVGDRAKRNAQMFRDG